MKLKFICLKLLLGCISFLIVNNNSLLAVASYNAGPNNVSNWVKQYKTQDPDLFVEEIPFKETKNYVKSVFSNYWNYLRIYDQETYLRLKQYK